MLLRKMWCEYSTPRDGRMLKRGRNEKGESLLHGSSEAGNTHLVCQSYNVPVEGSDELCHVEVSPFRPSQRSLNVVHAKDRVQSFRQESGTSDEGDWCARGQWSTGW